MQVAGRGTKTVSRDEDDDFEDGPVAGQAKKTRTHPGHGAEDAEEGSFAGHGKKGDKASKANAQLDSENDKQVPEARKESRCSECGQTGHNKRKCPNLKAANNGDEDGNEPVEIQEKERPKKKNKTANPLVEAMTASQICVSASYC